MRNWMACLVLLAISCAEPDRFYLSAVGPVGADGAEWLAVGAPYVLGIVLTTYSPGCTGWGCWGDDHPSGSYIAHAFTLLDVSCDGCDIERPASDAEAEQWREMWMPNESEDVHPVRVIPRREGHLTLRLTGESEDGELVDGYQVRDVALATSLVVVHDSDFDPGLLGGFLVGAAARWCVVARSLGERGLALTEEATRWSDGDDPSFRIREGAGSCAEFEAVAPGTGRIVVRAAGIERVLEPTVVAPEQVVSVEVHAVTAPESTYGVGYMSDLVDVSRVGPALTSEPGLRLSSGQEIVIVARTADGTQALVGMDHLGIVGAAFLEPGEEQGGSYAADGQGAPIVRVVANGESWGCLVVDVGSVHAEFPFVAFGSEFEPTPEFCQG